MTTKKNIMLKRIFDLVLGTLALFVAIPIIAISAILIRIQMGSPVFFTQLRPGLNGKKFSFIKLRTMKNTFNEHGEALEDSERLTPLGRTLRSFSIDELPSILNVLRGEMSLVGPRPLLEEYLPMYSVDQFRRHEVKPGLTGWAQINGRNAISWPEKFELDVWYVDNQSVLMDVRIILLTVVKLIKREGIASGKHVSMPKFKGND